MGTCSDDEEYKALNQAVAEKNEGMINMAAAAASTRATVQQQQK